MENKLEDKLRIVLDLDGPLLDRFKKLKNCYGLKSATDTMRTIIREHKIDEN